MKKNKIILTMVGIALSSLAYAQDATTASHTIGVTIPTLAIIDIEGGSGITFTFTSPSEPGNPILAPDPNSSLWLNYSSIMTGTTKKKISVKISSGSLPGVKVKLLAGAAAGNGAGERGLPSSELTLTSTDQALITGIGSAYTGNSTENGHKLTYTLEVDPADYSNYVSGSAASATVLYTISNES